MFKRLTLVLLLFVLAACGASEVEQTATENEAPAAAGGDANNAVDETVGQTNTAVDGVNGPFPANTVAEAAVVRDRDHVKGAEDAEVVIIEYGDFQ